MLSGFETLGLLYFESPVFSSGAAFDFFLTRIGFLSKSAAVMGIVPALDLALSLMLFFSVSCIFIFKLFLLFGDSLFRDFLLFSTVNYENGSADY